MFASTSHSRPITPPPARKVSTLLSRIHTLRIPTMKSPPAVADWGFFRSFLRSVRVMPLFVFLVLLVLAGHPRKKGPPHRKEDEEDGWSGGRLGPLSGAFFLFRDRPTYLPSLDVCRWPKTTRRTEMMLFLPLLLFVYRMFFSTMRVHVRTSSACCLLGRPPREGGGQLFTSHQTDYDVVAVLFPFSLSLLPQATTGDSRNTLIPLSLHSLRSSPLPQI